jgi:ribosome maturation factor RimP
MEKSQILSKIEEIVRSQGFVLVDLTFRGDHHLQIIEVFIDGVKGVTADDCESVSRAVDEAIEKENLIKSKYRLDVSSPGAERPLKFLLQYIKHVNRKFEVEFQEDGMTKKLTGKLLRIDGEDLFFSEKNAEYKINFNTIVKAKVIISF